MWLALGAYEFHGTSDLRLVDPCALHTQRFGLSHRQEQRIALSNQSFRASGVENDSRISGRRGRERQTRRNVRLDQTGDHIDRWTLGGEHQMHACSSCQLRDALDGAFHIILGHHHQIGHLVDDHQNVRIWSDLALRSGRGMHLTGAHGSIEVLDMAESEEFKIAVTSIHLLDHPFERLRSLLRIGDDRREQMWNTRVCR